MELKTTEEFVREAHGAACSTWKQRIEKEFPELFKTEFKLNKWYKTSGESLFFLTHFDGQKNKGYGFNSCKSYSDVRGDYGFFGYKENIISEATLEEVESAIEKEIIKRFGEDWENAKIEAHADGEPWIRNGLNKGFFDSGIGKNKVFSKHGVLYSNGVFAEPLKEKTIITKGKALRIIAKKLKVSPESIEIQ